MKTLQDALNYLNPDDDAQWTGNGLPLVEAVNAIWPEQVTRKQITEAAPNFNRDLLRDMKAAEEGEPVNVSDEDETQVTAPEASGDAAGEAKPADDEPEAVEIALTPYEECLALQKESEEKMNGLSQQISRLNSELRGEQLRHVNICVQRDRHKPRDMHGVNIRNYLNKQHETRMKKAIRQREILKVTSPSELDPRSPLDKRIGSKRNVRPLMNKTG